MSIHGLLFDYAGRMGNLLELMGRAEYSWTIRRYSLATFLGLRSSGYKPTLFTVPRNLVRAVSQSFMSKRPNQVKPMMGTPSSLRRRRFIHSFQSHSTA